VSELNFRADAETLRILEKIGLDKKDDFINRAVQAYATAGGAFEYAAGKGVVSGGGLSALSSAGSSTIGASSSTIGASAATGASATAAPGDLGAQLNGELERLLGPGSGVTAALAPGNPQLVEFHKAGQKIASLELSECQSILKSLRPPISLAEVVEMLTLMSVG
jgi:hypothetical protein